MAKRIQKNHKFFVSFLIFWKKKLAKLGNFAEKIKLKKSCLVPMSEGSGHPALTHHSSCLVSQKEQPQGPRNSPRTFLPARQNLGSPLSLSPSLSPVARRSTRLLCAFSEHLLRLHAACDAAALVIAASSLPARRQKKMRI
jgi:hypothetical protein